jgi:hypothetical protein
VFTKWRIILRAELLQAEAFKTEKKFQIEMLDFAAN